MPYVRTPGQGPADGAGAVRMLAGASQDSRAAAVRGFRGLGTGWSGRFGRNGTAFALLYVGTLVVLLAEQLVLRVPPLGYLDVAGLFAALNVLLALDRARAGLVSGGTVRNGVLAVLPVATVGTAVGAVVVASAGAACSLPDVLVGAVAFLAVFVAVTVALQYVLVQRSWAGCDDE